MTTFAEQLAADVENVFLNADEFAETVWYYPKTSPGTPRQISAVVHRGGKRDTAEQYTRTNAAITDLFASTDATTGIDSPQIGDAIRLAEDHPATRRGFVEEMHSDTDARFLRFRLTEIAHAGERPRIR